MSELPPPPPVSADGNFYWDGQSWVPMLQVQQSATQWPASPVKKRRSVTAQLVRQGVAGLLALGIVGFLVSSNLNRWDQANQQLATQAAAQQAQLALQSDQVNALQAEVTVLKQRTK